MRRCLAAAALGLLMLVLGAGPASAHAALVGSTPADGARLDALPGDIELDFNENVGRAAIAVTAPDGSAVDVSDITAVDSTVSAALADPGKQGRYSASYRVVSADGHPVQGTIVFTVTTGEVVDQTNRTESTKAGFVDRHTEHIVWGVGAGAVAVGLILLPLRRRDDPRDA